MIAWPEFVGIDGTHKLNNRNLVTWFWINEDSNGQSEVVGVALIVSEDKTTLQWMIQTFKEAHYQSWQNIKCIMTDKDLTE